jgi:hypothetical protein
MRFDSDLASTRAPYAGRHRKTPAYIRAASHLHLPQVALPSLAVIRRRPRPEPALADPDWPVATQPAA